MIKSIVIVLVVLSMFLGSIVMVAQGYAIAKKGIDSYACTINGLDNNCF